MLLKIKNFFLVHNIYKIIIFFVTGFTIRLIIHFLFEVNVFTDCLHYISILYYWGFSCFILFVNEYFNNIYLTSIGDNPNIINLPKNYKSNIINTSFMTNNESESIGETNKGTSQESSEVTKSTNEYIAGISSTVGKYEKYFDEFCTKKSSNWSNADLEYWKVKISIELYKGKSISEAIKVLPSDIRSDYKEFLWTTAKINNTTYTFKEWVGIRKP